MIYVCIEVQCFDLDMECASLTYTETPCISIFRYFELVVISAVPDTKKMSVLC